MSYRFRIPIFCLAGLSFFIACSAAAANLPAVISDVQQKLVKIYGAGGLRGLEAYQSGFFISDTGHVLTAWSTVLDSDTITVVLSDGRRFEAELLGADLEVETAVLKVEVDGVPHFDLAKSQAADIGTRTLAFSNLFGIAVGMEPFSVQHGIISSTTQLSARRGVFSTPYRGNVFVVDAVTNNPGAAGGVLTTWDGYLLGMLGKELRNDANHTWLNYAIPTPVLHAAVGRIVRGETDPASDQSNLQYDFDEVWRLDLAGILLVPDVFDTTPPFVDTVIPSTPGYKAGIRPDDLILYVAGNLVQSCRQVASRLRRLPHSEPLKLTLMRDNELHEVILVLTGQGDGPVQP